MGKILQICREEEDAKKAAAKQKETRQKKREKAKAKAQQGKLAAAPPLAIPPNAAPLPSLEPSNASEAGTARSESNASDLADGWGTQDAFQPSGQRHLSPEARQPPGHQSTAAQQRSQNGSSGQAPSMQAGIHQPARATSEALSVASADSDSAPDGGPWLSAAHKARHASLKPAPKPTQLATRQGSLDGQSNRQADASSSAAAAVPDRPSLRTHSAVPQPGGNVERLLRGNSQHGAQEAIPGGDQLPMNAPKRKKQRSKKGKLPRDGPDALEPAGSTPGMDEMPLQLDEANKSGEMPSSDPTPKIPAATDPLSSHTPAGPSASQQATASIKQSEAESASAAAAVLAAASGWSFVVPSWEVGSELSRF